MRMPLVWYIPLLTTFRDTEALQNRLRPSCVRFLLPLSYLLSVFDDIVLVAVGFAPPGTSTDDFFAQVAAKLVSPYCVIADRHHTSWTKVLY